MYDIIKSIINHEWVSNYTGDQSYIYYICGIVIVLFFVCIVDFLHQLINAVSWHR